MLLIGRRLSADELTAVQADPTTVESARAPADTHLREFYRAAALNNEAALLAIT